MLFCLYHLQGTEYFVTVILSAKNTTKGASNFTAMAEFGLDEIVVFQTDTTQPDNSARVLAGMPLMTITSLVVFNTLLASIGSTSGAQHETEVSVPTLGW